MMNWIAKIGALMRTMGSFTYRRVLRAGRWVTELIRVPGEPMPTEAPSPLREQTNADDYDSVKRLAAAMMTAAGPKPSDFGKIPELTVKWLRSLERAGLAKVATAAPQTLRGHMRGGQPIRGLVPYHAQAVAEVTAALKAPVARKDREMTLADLLEQSGMMPA